MCEPPSATSVFPFAAVVGQADLVEALMICVVAPDVGGVLIRGERGNAKSTAVRGLAELLAPAPLIEVPLGAALDRLVGSIDVGQALTGVHAVERGLLGRANGGMLYVDEVNLLADHLVDAMLDAAASGVVRVEREGVSAVHDARFTLVGTMNVEEGELRPQLLDRFGLGVDVRTPADPAVRAEIVRRRLAYEANPTAFTQRFADQQAAVTARVETARARYRNVHLGERELRRITAACATLGIDGIRGDLVTARASRALAALDGAGEVAEVHVRRAAELALAHRRQRDPLNPQKADPESLQRALDLAPEEPEPEPPDGGPDPAGFDRADDDAPNAPLGDDGLANGGPDGGSGLDGGDGSVGGDGAEGGGGDGGGPGRPGATGPRRTGSGLALPPRTAAPLPARIPREAYELTQRTGGPTAGSIDTHRAGDSPKDLAIVASLLKGSLREHVRAGRDGVLLCLVVDASGSMRARKRSARVKGALLDLLRDAYARRDRVALISFRGSGAELLVAPGAPLAQVAAALRDLETGGRTPLAEGLEAATDLIRREAMREPDRASIALVLTDGRSPDPHGRIAAAAAGLGRVADAVSVLDTEAGTVRLGMAQRLADAAGGERFGFAA